MHPSSKRSCSTRARSWARTLFRHPWRAVLRVGGADATGPADTFAWATPSLARVDRLLHPTNPMAGRLAAAVRTNERAPVAEYLRWADQILDDLMVSPPAEGHDLRDGLVD